MNRGAILRSGYTTIFPDRAFQIIPSANRFGLKCPCSKCSNGVRRKQRLVRTHLCQWGFMPGYAVWSTYGEHPIVTSTRMEEEPSGSDPLSHALVDIPDQRRFDGVGIEPAADANVFHKMVPAADEPLYDSARMSRLSAVKRLMELKSEENFSTESVNDLLALLGRVLPKGHKLPASVNECENMLSGLKVLDMKTDMCINNCMVYHEEHENKEKCDFVEKIAMKSLRGKTQGKHSRLLPKVTRCVLNIYGSVVHCSSM